MLFRSAVGRTGEVPDRLRRSALDFLERLSEAPEWRDAVAQGMRSLAGRKDLDHAERCGRIAAELAPPPPRPPPGPGGEEEEDGLPRPVDPPPRDLAQDYAEKAKIAEQMGRELQEQCLLISFGAGSPEEKTREIMKLQDAFQKKIKELYGS